MDMASLQGVHKKFGHTGAAIVVLWVGLAGAMQSASADAIDDYVASQMQKQHIAGLSLAVIKDGKPVKVQGYGSANLELNVPVSADTVFKIGSVSKQFIATGVMLLVEEGKVSLDDKITKYLDGAPETWSDITVLHVLSHTSGLMREGPGFAPYKLQTDAEVIKSAYAAPLQFKPGEKFQYCNLGYFILAEIVHKVSGKEWLTFMDERVFKPLQMTATRTTDVTALVPNRASGYAFKDGGQRNGANIIALRPSGAFLSTAVDLAKWSAALDAGSIVSRKTLDLMWTPVKLNSGEATKYGFGFYLDPAGSHRRMHHGGSMPGFRAEFARFPDDGLSIVVLANAEASMPEVISLGVAAQFIPDVFPARVQMRLKPKVLDEFTGRYKLDTGSTAIVARVDDELHLTIGDGGVEMALAPLAPSRFFWTDSPASEVTFSKAPGGGLQIVMQTGGTEWFKATRVP